MHESLKAICNSLDSLSEAVINGWSENRTMNEINGWNFPVLTRHDLGAIPKSISQSLSDLDPQEIDDTYLPIVNQIPLRLETFRARTLPYLYNGHGHQALPIYMSLMDYVNYTLQPIIGWKIVNDTKAMPNRVARRLNSINAQLDEIIPNKTEFEEKVKLINEAHSTVESLPMDIDEIRKAKGKVSGLLNDSIEHFSNLERNNNTSNGILKDLEDTKRDANVLVERCEEAYRITTTKGLAAAFDERASKASNSMWFWVFGLLCSLGAGSALSFKRFEIISQSLSQSTPDWNIVWMHIALSIISLTAPVWFAWVATKQIGQRFRLTEDYAFKASVAKAYEGYRKEAARIDPAFEARLFSSALSRLEEAPLRLMESTNHGSPWHELITSPQFQTAINKIPELKDKFINVVKDWTGSRKNDISESEIK